MKDSENISIKNTCSCELDLNITTILIDLTMDTRQPSTTVQYVGFSFFKKYSNFPLILTDMAYQLFPYWKRLFTGTLPVNKKHLTGTVPVNKKHLTGTVPVNKKHLIGTLFVHYTDEFDPGFAFFGQKK